MLCFVLFCFGWLSVYTKSYHIRAHPSSSSVKVYDKEMTCAKSKVTELQLCWLKRNWVYPSLGLSQYYTGVCFSFSCPLSSVRVNFFCSRPVRVNFGTGRKLPTKSNQVCTHSTSINVPLGAVDSQNLCWIPTQRLQSTMSNKDGATLPSQPSTDAVEVLRRYQRLVEDGQPLGFRIIQEGEGGGGSDNHNEEGSAVTLTTANAE